MHVLAKYKSITIDCTEEELKSMPENTFGQRVRKQRIKKNLLIKKLAQMVDTTPQTISNIEKNRTISNIVLARNLSKALDVSISYLLNLDQMLESTPGQIIKKYRLISGLTQEELAAECNISPYTLSDYEVGKIKFRTSSSIDNLNKIYSAISYNEQ